MPCLKHSSAAISYSIERAKLIALMLSILYPALCMTCARGHEALLRMLVDLTDPNSRVWLPPLHFTS